MEIYEHNISVGRPWGSVDTINKGEEHEYKKGDYYFYGGIVEIYSETNITNFSFLYKGRIYQKGISKLRKQYTDMGLIRLAGKFGKEIVNKIENN